MDVFGETMPSEDLIKTDPMSEQENKPPPNILSSPATNCPRAAHLSNSPIGRQWAERTDTFVPYKPKNQMDLPSNDLFKLPTVQRSSSTSVENQQEFSTPYQKTI